jgi:predicted nuclease with TOPRIM domain
MQGETEMDVRTQAIIKELANQRNNYSDASAALVAEIAVRNALIAEWEKKWNNLELVRARIEELTREEGKQPENLTPPSQSA